MTSTVDPERRAHRRRPAALGRLSVAVLIAGASLVACSSDATESGGDTAAPATTTTIRADDGSDPAEPVSLATLPAPADREGFADIPPFEAPAPPDEDAELTELAARRAEIADRTESDPDDQYTRVLEATPIRFTELTVDVARRRSLNPLRISRAVGLLSVAAHHGALGADRAGAVDDRPAPDEVDPSMAEPVGGIDVSFFETPEGRLPPELVTAGAQRRVACDLFPTECPRLDRLARVATDRAVASGRVWPSTIDAATAYGDAVGRSVSELGASDGAAPWTPGNPPPPSGGSWEPTPGSFSPALEPGAPSWRPWNLDRGDEFRPPPPPEPGSAEFDEALQEVYDQATNIGQSDLRVAKFWDLGAGTSTPPGYWLNDAAAESLRSLNVADQAMAMALVATAVFDTGIAVFDSKYHDLLIRPVTAINATIDDNWLPSIPTPAFPAYVSGHSGFSGAAALVLASLLPARADEFLDAAAEAGDSRIYGGIHYWFDNYEGELLGEQVAEVALVRFGVTPTDATRASSRIEFGAEPR